MLIRIGLSIVIITVCLIAGIIGFTDAAHDSPNIEVKCIDLNNRERLKLLTTQALDDAFKTQIKHLYEIWMRDPNTQPRRAQAGVSQAIAAWIIARKGVEKFEPPECPK